MLFWPKNSRIQASFRIANRYSLQRNLSLTLTFSSLAVARPNSVLEIFLTVVYSLRPRSLLLLEYLCVVGIPTTLISVFFLFPFHTYPSFAREFSSVASSRR